jgi:hypothetical protein
MLEPKKKAIEPTSQINLIAAPKKVHETLEGDGTLSL